MQPPSQISLVKIAQQVLRLVKQDGFNRGDAIKVLQITKGMDKAGPKVLKEMQREMKDIYARNYKAVKSSQTRDTA